MGILAPYGGTDLVGTWMVIRGEQGPYDGKPLGCDGNPALMTSRNELAESLSGVPLTPPSIHQPDFSHKPLLADNDTEHDRQPAPGKKEMTADGLEVCRFSRYLPSSATND